ncbi:hypothetical protein OIU74_008925 [Salix koriyanagi]|uniref:Uncharacterized protein n=1 Tax=Salix koriyanagi TaxID=2511006 RepID=A0A9Q0YZV1_9ROSI|nr:hypothetical protein OIU74_008925 [Salix koriyanagi]
MTLQLDSRPRLLTTRTNSGGRRLIEKAAPPARPFSDCVNFEHLLFFRWHLSCLPSSFNRHTRLDSSGGPASASIRLRTSPTTLSQEPIFQDSAGPSKNGDTSPPKTKGGGSPPPPQHGGTALTLQPIQIFSRSIYDDAKPRPR